MKKVIIELLVDKEAEENEIRKDLVFHVLMEREKILSYKEVQIG